MVHCFKSFTYLSSLFLLIEGPVTLICSGEGFQHHCLSRDWINLALQSKFPTLNLCILIHVLQKSQFTGLNLKIKVSGGLIWPSKHCNIKDQYWDFKLWPKYSDPRATVAAQNKWNQSRKGTGSTWEGEGRGKARMNEGGTELVLQLSPSHGCNSSQGLKLERLCCLIKKCYLDL